MHDIHGMIREKEREIERLKAQFSLGKASLAFSRRRIEEVEKKIKELSRKLPPHERQLHDIKKEFGNEF